MKTTNTSLHDAKISAVQMSASQIRGGILAAGVTAIAIKKGVEPLKATLIGLGSTVTISVVERLITNVVIKKGEKILNELDSNSETIEEI